MKRLGDLRGPPGDSSPPKRARATPRIVASRESCYSPPAVAAPKLFLRAAVIARPVPRREHPRATPAIRRFWTSGGGGRWLYRGGVSPEAFDGSVHPIARSRTGWIGRRPP